MDNCTEGAGRWPDALADVSQEEIDEFIAHAEVCAYHGALLEAEDEDFRHTVRHAKLFGRGRLLKDEELGHAGAVVRRQLERFDAAAHGEQGVRLKRVSLYNGRRPIAKWSYHSPHEKYVFEIKLDREAGLEVRGVVAGKGRAAGAWRLAYPLARVRHTGEKLLPVGYGYAVGLKVREVEGDIFRIEFRCVEEEVTAAERAEKEETSLSSLLSRLRGRLFVLTPLLPPAFAAMLLTLGATLLAMTLKHHPSPVRAEVAPKPPKTKADNGRGTNPRLKATSAPLVNPALPPLVMLDGKPVPDEGEPMPRANRPREAGRPDTAAEEQDPDLAAAKAWAKRIIHSYRHSDAQQAAHRRTRTLHAPAVHVRERRTWRPERAILSALKTRTRAGETFVIFETGENKELRKKLSERIVASGGEVVHQTPTELELSVRDLPKVEVVVTREAAGVGLLFKTEVADTAYKWGPYRGSGDDVMGVSALDNALNRASPEVFSKLKELLSQQAAHDPVESIRSIQGEGGGNVDPRVPLDVQRRVRVSRRGHPSGGLGDDIIPGRRPGEVDG